MASLLNILVLEPYYGGSHRAFLDALIKYSSHRYTLMTLPARKWKWRMRGAAVWFAQELARRQVGDIDLVLTCDMLSVADLRALLPSALSRVPQVCYFHENQLTYPIPDESDRDFQYGFTNLTSCLASDVVWFNSRFHMDGFLSAVGGLLRKMPDHVPAGMVRAVQERSMVRYPPVDMAGLEQSQSQEDRGATPLRILWNHRWEYDKNPEPFFAAIQRLDESGCDFRLVMVGETFRDAPAVFARSCARLGDKVEHGGYLESRADYLRALRGCDVVVSTAIQENFGIAVVEAMAAGCRPLLPRRLSYPELVPNPFHEDCLYKDYEDMFERLRRLTVDPTGVALPEVQASMVERFSAASNVRAYDDAFGELVGGQDGVRRGDI